MKAAFEYFDELNVLIESQIEAHSLAAMVCFKSLIGYFVLRLVWLIKSTPFLFTILKKIYPYHPCLLKLDVFPFLGLGFDEILTWWWTPRCSSEERTSLRVVSRVLLTSGVSLASWRCLSLSPACAASATPGPGRCWSPHSHAGQGRSEPLCC